MRPRRLGGEQATIMVSAQVLTVAVPMPCRKRRPMTVSMPGAKNSGRDGGREQQHAAQADALAAPLVAGPAHDEMKNGQSQAVNGPHKTELGAAGMQFPPYGRQHHGNAGVHERS